MGAAACWCLSCSLYSLLHHSHLSARTLVASLQPSTAPLYSDSRHVFHLKMCTIQLCSKKRQEGSPRQDCPASSCVGGRSTSAHSVFYYLFPRVDVGQYIELGPERG